MLADMKTLIVCIGTLAGLGLDDDPPADEATIARLLTIAQERRIYGEVLESQRKAAQVRVELDR